MGLTGAEEAALDAVRPIVYLTRGYTVHVCCMVSLLCGYSVLARRPRPPWPPPRRWQQCSPPGPPGPPPRRPLRRRTPPPPRRLRASDGIIESRRNSWRNVSRRNNHGTCRNRDDAHLNLTRYPHLSSGRYSSTINDQCNTSTCNHSAHEHGTSSVLQSSNIPM